MSDDFESKRAALARSMSRRRERSAKPVEPVVDEPVVDEPVVESVHVDIVVDSAVEAARVKIREYRMRELRMTAAERQQLYDEQQRQRAEREAAYPLEDVARDFFQKFHAAIPADTLATIKRLTARRNHSTSV